MQLAFEKTQLSSIFLCRGTGFCILNAAKELQNFEKYPSPKSSKRYQAEKWGQIWKGMRKMKIQIQEEAQIPETEVIIRCREANQQILKMIAMMRVYDRKLTGSKRGETYILDVAKILYIDTVDKKTFFYTKDEVYETSMRLYELEERLGECDFFRASKSTIVNFNQIRSLRPDFGGRMLVQMNNGEKLVVSRQYVPVIKEKLGIL